MAKLPRLRVEIYLDRESRAWIVALFRRDRAVILGGHSSEEAATDAAFEHARNYRECAVVRRDSDGSTSRLDQFRLISFQPDLHWGGWLGGVGKACYREGISSQEGWLNIRASLCE